MVALDLANESSSSHQAEEIPVIRPTPAQVLHDLSALDLPADTVSDGISAYFLNHCNRPCPLLDHLSEEPLSHQYPPLVLTAMLALSIRSTREVGIRSARYYSQTLVQRSWDLLVDSYRRFDMNDSYFQALCLLAQVDFAEGRAERARTQVALGLRLAQSRGMLDKAHYQSGDEYGCRKHQEIVYSLCILDRMFTSHNIPNASIPQRLFRLPAYHYGPIHPEQGSGVHNPSSAQNLMIVNSLVLMLHTWELTTQCINESLTGTSQPIWHHKSIRTAILTRLLEHEIRKSKAFSLRLRC